MPLDVQLLSPWADAAPSPYMRLQPGDSFTLDVAFTYTHSPAGRFTFEGAAAGSPNAVLHLNVRDNDYYQNGIPGITGSVAQTAEWLDRVRRALGARCVRMIGASMGAYAALLFGDLLHADAIYAFSPVLRPGHLALGLATSFEDISPRLPALAPRTVFTFGAFELGEYQFVQPCLEAGLAMADLTLLANFHPGLLSIRLAELFGSAIALPAAALTEPPHRSGLDHHDVAMLAATMDAVAAGDHEAVCIMLGAVTRRDSLNPGLHYRLGVHQMLAGWNDAAMVSLGYASRMLQQIGPRVLGSDADLKRKSVHDYGHMLGFAPLKALHALIDAASA